MMKKSEKEELGKKKPSNPELEREEEEKRIESGKSNDFHDVGGFPKAPVTGGIL